MYESLKEANKILFGANGALGDVEDAVANLIPEIDFSEALRIIKEFTKVMDP